MRVQVPLHRRNGKSASPILTISNWQGEAGKLNGGKTVA
ncbi:hypothetical protein M595_6115 [Lyngbya aestuarii BL J]|uniref:Uncharacterized protein n=1 Tax=Lyngbya aestuarii BL J TaxID=1348334 RepID=U7Q802_9CYAN|nr:hypothetical protein M595_6115 [Lyngbya aestuarii BL J]